MDAQPLISIITVTYNASDVINKTMESLKSQTFKDFEHLVIDGASKDNTLQLIKESGLSATRIVSEPDNGLYDAMNKGLRMAKGKYLLFLNAGDTFYDATTLAHYADKAEKDNDIIFGDTIIVDNKGNKISNRHLSAPEKLTKKSFANGMLICHQAFMVKKSLAPQYNLDYRFSADYDWCVNCISAASKDRCVNLKEVTIKYLSDGLTDKHKWASLKERFRIMSHHYGLPSTLIHHISFIFRALRRGKV